jgi:CRP-like cAMP-binding protein
LGFGIPEDEWDAARHACRGPIVRVAPGRWNLPDAPGRAERVFVLVILEGVLSREIALRDRHLLELLGRGDILQLPIFDGRPRLSGPTRFTAATGVVMIALGESFIRAAAHWPSLLISIGRRLEAQREHLAVQGLVVHLPLAEHRLLLILWHLADRWGRVTPDGTVVSLPLTHDLLGHLAAARRSTTTLAMQTLEGEGFVRRREDGLLVLTAAAEAKVDAIADSSSTPRDLGETLRLRHATGELSRARRVEARQVSARRAETSQVVELAGHQRS